MAVDRRRTILLVDDDATLRELLRATLPDEYEVIEAADAHGALEAIDGQDLDLVVLDWRLPDGSGGDVLAYTKAQRPDLPVIVLTAEAHVEAEQADAFLRKPFSPLELLDLVDVLAGWD